MNDHDARLAVKVLRALRAIVRERMAPAEAMRTLPQGETYDGRRLVELLWDDARDGTGRHYDALVHLADGATLSLAWCAPLAVPWPLRGARRFDDADLLRVGDRTLGVGEAFGHIDAMLADRAVGARLVELCLVREELERSPVRITAADRQRAMDAFRRTHGLHKAEACRAWMARRGLSEEQFAQIIEDHAALAVLRRRVTADAVPAFFAAHREAYDRLQVAVVECRDEAAARRLRAELESGQTDFLLAAQASLAGREGSAVVARSLRRGLQPAPWFDEAYRAPAGALVGPVVDGERVLVLKVLARTPAALDDATREAVASELFARWLAERREQTSVEWFWHDEAPVQPDFAPPPAPAARAAAPGPLAMSGRRLMR